MKRKLLLILFVIVTSVFVFGMMNVSAALYEELNLTYEVVNGEATITYCNNKYIDTVEIPENIGVYPVTKIGDGAFEKCTLLKCVVISEKVNTIGKRAFFGCENLKDITIPESVVIIGENAFKGCDAGKKVHIRSLEAWCNISFEGVYSYYSSPRGNLYINGELITDMIIPYGITEIKDSTFCGLSGLTSVTIPDSVIKVGEYAFKGCYNLKSIELPNSITTIGRSAFGGCGITSINIPNSMTSIGDFAFENSLINDIYIPNTVTSIGKYAFSGCVNLTSINIPDSVTSIGGYAFRSSGLISVEIPDSVVGIGDCAFETCGNLKSIKLSNNLKTIGHMTFSYCRSLESIDIPDGVTAIGEYAFQMCSNLTNVDIPNSVTTISRCSFYSCVNLTNIIIPDNISILNENTFYKCSNLINVHLPEEIIAIGGNAFGDCNSIEKVYFSGSKAQWENISKSEGNEYLTSATIIYSAKKTYKFETNCETILLDVIDYAVFEEPFIECNGKTFAGWYDNKELIGEPITFPYYGMDYSSANTLYAAWSYGNEKYHINSISLKEPNGYTLTEIPNSRFLATVSITNVSSNENTVVVLAQYSALNEFKGLMYVTAEDMPIGATFKLSVPIDNTSGEISKLKAFSWASFNDLTPMGNTIVFSEE